MKQEVVHGVVVISQQPHTTPDEEERVRYIPAAKRHDDAAEAPHRSRGCPHCSPYACGPDCPNGSEDWKPLHVPYSWTCRCCSALAVMGVVAAVVLVALRFGSSTLSGKQVVRQDCGGFRGSLRMLVKLEGVSRDDLEVHCLQVRAAIASAVGSEFPAQNVSVVDVKESSRRASVYVTALLTVNSGGSAARRADQLTVYNLVLSFLASQAAAAFSDLMGKTVTVQVLNSGSDGVSLAPVAPPPPPSDWSCPPHAVAPAGAVSRDACECVAGFYQKDGECQTCPDRFYCPPADNLARPCPANSQSSTGASKITDCSCLPGYFGRPGTSCLPCEVGYVCPGNSSLTPCPPGKTSRPTSVKLLDCFCNAGTFQSLLSSSCLTCTAGSYCALGQQTECPAGTFSSSSSSTCSSCPVGKQSAAGSSSCVEIPCPPNSAKVIDASSNSFSCFCASSFYMNSNMTCSPCDLLCPAGTFLVGCRDKSPGSCSPCDQNFFATDAAAGRVSCTACSTLRCDPGMFLQGCGGLARGVCASCPPSSYAEGTQYRTECSPCGSQLSCPAGEQLEGCGLSSRGSCAPCADGFYSLGETLRCLSCLNLSCSPGSFRQGCGGSSAGACLACPNGKYTPYEDGVWNQQQCSPCPVASCGPEQFLADCLVQSPGTCRDLQCVQVGIVKLCNAIAASSASSLLSLEVPPQVPSDSALGISSAWLGDGKLAVGAYLDKGESSWNQGAVYIFDVKGSSTLLSRINGSSSSSPPTSGDGFGFSVAAYTKTAAGAQRLLVGSPFRESQYFASGGVWVVTLTSSLKEDKAVELKTQGIASLKSDNMQFGCAIAVIGDVNGDNIPDIAVSACRTTNPGIVYVLCLDNSLSVVAFLEVASASFVSDTSVGLPLAPLGDLDGNHVPDLCVGASAGAGKLFLLFLDANATSYRLQEVKRAGSSLASASPNMLSLGIALTHVGDVDGDGVTDLVVASRSSSSGSLFLVMLNRNGSAHAFHRLQTEFAVAPGDNLIRSLSTSPLDLNNNSLPDFAVGSFRETLAIGGAVEILSLDLPLGSVLK